MVAPVLLAIAALAVGIRQQSKIESLRAERDRLARELVANGGDRSLRTRSHERIGGGAAARGAVDELIRLATLKDHGPQDPEVLADLAAGFDSMTPAEIRETIDRVLSDDSIEPRTRRGLLSHFLNRLMENHPFEAIERIDGICSDLPEWMNGYGFDPPASGKAYGMDLRLQQVLATRRWAEVEPVAAWRWACERTKKTEEAASHWSRAALLQPVASGHPELALQFADEMNLKGIGFMAWPGQTRDQKLASYNALRQRFGSDSEELREGIMALALSRGHERAIPFADATGWIEEAGLTKDDLDFFADPSRTDLCYHIDPVETGKWIDWLLQTFPADSAGRRIGRFFEDHRTRDAARDWLAAQPEETARRVRSFIDIHR